MAIKSFIINDVHRYSVAANRFSLEDLVGWDFDVLVVDDLSDFGELLRWKKIVKVQTEAHCFILTVEADIDESVLTKGTSPYLTASIMHQ